MHICTVGRKSDFIIKVEFSYGTLSTLKAPLNTIKLLSDKYSEMQFKAVMAQIYNGNGHYTLISTIPEGSSSSFTHLN